MTREELSKVLLEDSSQSFLLELCTSFGKSKLALDKANQWYTNKCKILIVIPRLVLIDNWKKEFVKFGYDKILNNAVFTTYHSFPKSAGTWDIVILDECHHMSSRCREALNYFTINHLICLSATVKQDLKYFFSSRYHTKEYSVGLQSAINDDVLPEPDIYLLPLRLNNTEYNRIINQKGKNGSKVAPITINYADKWKYKGYTGPLNIRCTQRQYYNELSGLIEWYKKKSTYSTIMKNQWLHKAGERLKWLSEQKTALINAILEEYKKERTLVFCGSIEQSEDINCPSVNSKIGKNALDKFNNKKIKHISAIGMLDEGITLTQCRIGIFQMINSSEKLVVQRTGRLMRHKRPMIIFPYYVDTREEEIIEKIASGYDPKLIHRISSFKDIKL